MADLPPDWAIERVLAEYAVQHPTRWTIATIKGTPRATEGFCTVVLNYARYIAEHEERPLDPVKAAVEHAVRTTSIHEFPGSNEVRLMTEAAQRAVSKYISLSQGNRDE